MTSVVGNLGAEAHLSELNSPLLGNAGGVLSSAARKALARGNLGLETASGAVPVQILTQATPQTATGTATLTAAQITSGILIGTPTAAAAYTLPLASALDTALPGLVAGQAFDLFVINAATTDTFDITMTTNTGWTLVGGMLVQENENGAHNSSGHFRVHKTGTAAYTLYRLAK